MTSVFIGYFNWTRVNGLFAFLSFFTCTKGGPLLNLLGLLYRLVYHYIVYPIVSITQSDYRASDNRPNRKGQG
jgi:hypothetical protein